MKISESYEDKTNLRRTEVNHAFHENLSFLKKMLLNFELLVASPLDILVNALAKTKIWCVNFGANI